MFCYPAYLDRLAKRLRPVGEAEKVIFSAYNGLDHLKRRTRSDDETASIHRSINNILIRQNAPERRSTSIQNATISDKMRTEISTSLVGGDEKLQINAQRYSDFPSLEAAIEAVQPQEPMPINIETNVANRGQNDALLQDNGFVDRGENQNANMNARDQIHGRLPLQRPGRVREALVTVRGDGQRNAIMRMGTGEDTSVENVGGFNSSFVTGEKQTTDQADPVRLQISKRSPSNKLPVSYGV